MRVEPITQEGYDLLLLEFKFLKDKEKPKVNREKQEAAAQGDRSENADYHAAKEKLRHIDKRLFYLNSMIEKSKIIDPSILKHDRVSFGSTITLLDLESDEEREITICGVLESEPDNLLISIHAPLSQAMLGKLEGDDFIVTLPNGKKEYEIVKIEYINIFSLKQVIKSEKEFAV